MSQLDAANISIDKTLVSKIVWDLFDSIATKVISVKTKLWRFPISVSIQVAQLAPLIELLVGPHP